MPTSSSDRPQTVLPGLVTLALGGVLVFGLASYAVARWAPMVSIGEQSAFTWSDINRLYTVEQWIGEVLGDSAVESRRDVLYNLAIYGLQKEWLQRERIHTDRTRSTQALEERTVLKGLHNRIKGYLGDDYYRLYVEPVTMNQVFEAWYKEREPGLRLARVLHAQALESGFDKITETHRTIEVLLPGTEGNRVLVAQLAALQARQPDDAVGSEADGQGQATVYEKMVDIGSAYLILPAQTATVKEQRLAVQAVAVQKQAYAEVLSAVASKVPVEFSVVSVYDREDLRYRENSVF